MLRLFDFLPSGNGYKVRLTLKELGLAYELVELDITAGATRTPEFLAINPNGRIPLLAVPGQGYLAESHAIVAYLARGSSLVPEDPWQQALVAQWLCFEQYSLEPKIGTARYWLRILGRTPLELGALLTDKQAEARQALGVLEAGLAGQSFLVGERYTLADLALYAYTHLAPEAGVALEGYPAIRAWLARVESRPRFAPITAR